MPERTVQIRFERKSPTQRVVVYYKGERMGQARSLDPVANDRPPRKPGADPDSAGNPVGAHPKAAAAFTAGRRSNHSTLRTFALRTRYDPLSFRPPTQSLRLRVGDACSPHQQEIFDILRVHAQQGGLCLVLGEPGTGKSVLKQACSTTTPNA